MSFYKNLRLDLSQKLLSQSHLSVTEIALSSGFTVLHNFHKLSEEVWQLHQKFKNM